MTEILRADEGLDKSPLKKRARRWPILIGLLFAGWTAANYSFQQYGHAQTLQNILDKNEALKVFKINSVRFPFYEALPLSENLSQFGLLPSEYASFFTVEFKDGHTLSEACKFNTYDYSVRIASYDKKYFQISAPNVLQLRNCL